MKNNNSSLRNCTWCSQPSYIIWVHGHGQCSLCGINIDECCRGEALQVPANIKREEEDNGDQTRLFRSRWNAG